MALRRAGTHLCQAPHLAAAREAGIKYFHGEVPRPSSVGTWMTAGGVRRGRCPGLAELGGGVRGEAERAEAVGQPGEVGG